MLLARVLPASAQGEASVEVVAGVVAAADARSFQEPLFEDAARQGSPSVRRQAALAMGRIGNPAATPLLLELLSDPDSTVRQEAAFALGQIGDRTALSALITAAQSRDSVDAGVALEAVTAIAKIAGEEGAAFLRDLLARWVAGPLPEIPGTVERALWEAWRLGEQHMPVAAVEPYATSTSADLRRAAIYSLARTRALAAAGALLAAITDPDIDVREVAVRALTRAFVDSAGLDPQGAASRIARLVRDDDPGVRINALRTLATYAEPALAADVIPRVADPDPNVRVEALVALGALGGPEAARILDGEVAGKLFATRRQALLSLARVDHRRGLVAAARWITDTAWRRRIAGAAALGLLGGDTATAWLERLIDDPDGRVAAAAYSALAEAAPERARADAVRRLEHRDPVVRTIAAAQIARSPEGVDVEALVGAYARAQRDSISDARVAAVRALAAIADLGFSQRVAVGDAFLSRFPTCDDYLVRRAAQQVFPQAAQRWGPPAPIATGLGAAAYRDIVRRMILPGPRTPRPELILETDRGRIEVALYGADAPLTATAWLRLADERFFDGGQWHRVVPNFVVQDGDPRGDGSGGPGFVLRDEINRHRYRRGSVGLALSGPDTGGSQFFITVAREPHLDGTYPVIGYVISGMDVVDRITQGDRLRTVRRR